MTNPQNKGQSSKKGKYKMEKILVKAKETIRDQFGNIRLHSHKEYEFINSYEGSYTVIDETGKEATFGEERFQPLLEN